MSRPNRPGCSWLEARITSSAITIPAEAFASAGSSRVRYSRVMGRAGTVSGNPSAPSYVAEREGSFNEVWIMVETRSIRETDTDTHIISRKAAIEILFINGGSYGALGLLRLRRFPYVLLRGSIHPRSRSAGTTFVDVRHGGYLLR